MRVPLLAALLALLAATPGCLQAALSEAEGDALAPGTEGAVGGYAEFYREEGVVPLWVGAAGRYTHLDAPKQFQYNVTSGLAVIVAEARWTPTTPGPVNSVLKLLVLGPDRTILGEAEGTSPLRIELPGEVATSGAPLTAYVVGAEDAVALTKDQPYEMAVTLFYGQAPEAGYSAFA